MKSNFNSKLFEKQIDLKSCNEVIGGGSGCAEVIYTNGGQDTQSYYYNEEGVLIRETYCENPG